VLAHLSKTPGIGGALKESPEDFVVEEMAQDGTVLKIGKAFRRKPGKGRFTLFVLQKSDWTTPQALKALGERLGCGPKRFGYAGTKDRKALTTQLCSAWEVPPERLMDVKVRGIQINGAWASEKGLELGDLAGNSFTVTVRGAKPRSAANVKKIFKELKGRFPNYFGEQRFGSARVNTHAVGKLIIRGDLEAAVQNYLCFSGTEENPAAREARARLASEKSYADALDYFPQHLKYERSMIRHLAEFKNDYAGALRALPRGISLMFVHAYQSQLFNELLGARVAGGRLKPAKGDWVCPKGRLGFPDLGRVRMAEKAGERWSLCLPIIGYGSSELSEEAEALLRREGLTPASFRIKSLPELSARGGLRAALAPLRKFGFSQRRDSAVFKFMLPPGAYATVAMREFIDESK